MGHLVEKYTKEYFLNSTQIGIPDQFGVADLLDSGVGGLSAIDKAILGDLDFRDRTVLDFGFGRGESIKYARIAGAKRVLGVDFAQAAYEIATQYLKNENIEAQLFNLDAMAFVANLKKQERDLKIDIVLMLNFMEHVPRREMSQIFTNLKTLLSDKAIIAINTPVFSEDNDVLEEGLKRGSIDTSDLFAETCGMHCNKYTKNSLRTYLHRLGYKHLSGHFFAKEMTKLNRKRGLENYVFLSDNSFSLYETVEIPNQYNERLSKMRFPVWHTIARGILRGRQFYIDDFDSLWQKEILDGSFDSHIWKELRQMDLKGKTVLDIGAHVGFHSMAFAELVGPLGKVIAFEPNPHFSHLN